VNNVVFLFSVGFLFAGVMLAFLLWAHKMDQFRDVESVKYRMMDLEPDDRQPQG
jgi:cbb3-type cytochrome oxidase maturation protein